MNLALTRPLIIFDLETTGINTSKDRIIEIYLIKISPDGARVDKHFYFNPEMNIPKEATAIHGITNERVANEPTFKERANELHQFINNSDFAGFNSNKFDFPMLVEEFLRSGISLETNDRQFVDAQRIFHLMEPRNLSAAYRFYCQKELENAHSAKADTEATWEIIQAQLDRYSQLENNVTYLHNFTSQNNQADLAGRFVYNDKREIIFNFGKHKGKTVKEVLKNEPSYYEWMMNGEFAAQTKNVLTQIRLSTLENK